MLLDWNDERSVGGAFGSRGSVLGRLFSCGLFDPFTGSVADDDPRGFVDNLLGDVGRVVDHENTLAGEFVEIERKIDGDFAFGDGAFRCAEDLAFERDDHLFALYDEAGEGGIAAVVGLCDITENAQDRVCHDAGRGRDGRGAPR